MNTSTAPAPNISSISAKAAMPKRRPACEREQAPARAAHREAQRQAAARADARG